MRRYGDRHKWLGFLDADEFVVLRNNRSAAPLIEFLESFAHSPGLALNWYQFGSSDHLTRPTGGVLTNYRQCYKNHEVKSFCQTQFLNRDGLWLGLNRSFHQCYFLPGYDTLDVFGNVVRKGASRAAVSRLEEAPAVVYHYSIQSLEDFEAKMVRGRNQMQTL